MVTWPADGVFGPLLEAAGEFVETGGQHAAERAAEEARALKVLTTVPHLRHYRQPAPAKGADPEAWFGHERIGIEGNGYLALTEAELVAATGRTRTRGILSSLRAPDSSAYVVVWDDHSAPGLVLSGVHLAYTDPEYGATLLHQRLHSAAQALVPGPRDMEWR
ncbi:hypothetical protein [Streptomyces sp. NPDC048606]|uniref:hypothetical protein n=1 Tax=Streptomyces sp. NPDC048606 TaxID=3154726 RepID=UPI003432A6A6